MNNIEKEIESIRQQLEEISVLDENDQFILRQKLQEQLFLLQKQKRTSTTTKSKLKDNTSWGGSITFDDSTHNLLLENVRIGDGFYMDVKVHGLHIIFQAHSHQRNRQIPKQLNYSFVIPTDYYNRCFLVDNSSFRKIDKEKVLKYKKEGKFDHIVLEKKPKNVLYLYDGDASCSMDINSYNTVVGQVKKQSGRVFVEFIMTYLPEDDDVCMCVRRFSGEVFGDEIRGTFWEDGELFTPHVEQGYKRPQKPVRKRRGSFHLKLLKGKELDEFKETMDNLCTTNLKNFIVVE